MKKGDEIELTITGYAFEGKGIAKIQKDGEGENSFVVFVDRSFPGDTVVARISKVKKNYAESRAISIITPSELRQPARCRYTGVCGGCKQQELQYPVQAKYKQQQVVETLKSIGGVEEIEVEPIIGAENEFYYRNKMEFSFAAKRWLTSLDMDQKFEPTVAVGLHVPGVYDKVLDIEECFLQSEQSAQIVNASRKFFIEAGKDVYTIKTHTGYLRNLVIRQASYTPGFMVNIVTSYEDDTTMNAYKAMLLEKFPQITSIVNNINTGKALVAFGEYEIVLHGEPFIYEKIGNYNYRVSANSFFQTNSTQAKKLYDTIVEYAELTGNETVYDLYCGAGTITLYVSGLAKQVIGFETVQAAVDDARVNKELNENTNTEFYVADLNKSLLPIKNANNLTEPDVLIADPPRAGMNPNTIQDILTLSPKKIVYVSCNPATQARDIKLLHEGGYKTVKIRPVDMFPHTYHIENVALLVRAGV